GKSAIEEADLSLRITDHYTRNTLRLGNEILIHNKCDLDHYNKNISISAKTGEGLVPLINFLKEKLLSFDSQYSSYSISESERSIIRNVLNLLDKIVDSGDITLLAEDLRNSANS